MKKIIVCAALVLASAPAAADRVRDALWSDFQRNPHKVDICARKIASGLDFNRATDWPSYCNHFEKTDLVKSRAAEIKSAIEGSGGTAQEVALIKQGKVWIGATAAQAELSWGRPAKVNRTITARMTREQWVYGSSYLYLTDGKVTAIQN